MSASKHLLLVFGGNAGGRTHAMVAAARQGMTQGLAECGSQIPIRESRALEAGVEDLMGAHGLLLATPEHFGYMSGALKHFFDRTFYPVEGKLVALPYALMVSAGNDGAGTVNAVERIVLGYRWKKIAEPIVARGELSAAVLERCHELGQLLAAGVAMDLF